MRQTPVFRLVSLITIGLFVFISFGTNYDKSRATDVISLPKMTRTNPADLPIIDSTNARILSIYGILGHGINMQALWLKDGYTLVVGGMRGIYLYDTRLPNAEPRQLFEPDMPVASMTLSHDGTHLAVSAGVAPDGLGIGSSIREWDTRTWAQVLAIQAQTLPIAFSPDDSRIIGYGVEHSHFPPFDLAAWDSKTGRQLVFTSGYSITPDLDRNPGIVPFIGDNLRLGALVNPDTNIDVVDIQQKQSKGKYQPATITISIPSRNSAAYDPIKSVLAINVFNCWLFGF